MELEVCLGRRKFTPEFTREAVSLIRDRGVNVAQASRDLAVHRTFLHDWLRAAGAAPEPAFPGHGRMPPEQAEIVRLRREVTRLKAERDILKKPRPTLRRTRREVRLHREALGDLAGSLVVWGARCLAMWLLWLAETVAQPRVLSADSIGFSA